MFKLDSVFIEMSQKRPQYEIFKNMSMSHTAAPGDMFLEHGYFNLFRNGSKD